MANGAATWIDVTTGMTIETAQEVFGNLTPGDLVVKRGTDAIPSGAKVKPIMAK